MEGVRFHPMSDLRITFAVKASGKTGAGHIMRCLRYAQSLSSLGFKIKHWGSVDIPWILEFSEHTFVDYQEQIHETDLLIIDSYDLDFIVQAVSSVRTNKVVQIADANTPLIPSASLVWLDIYPIPESVSSSHQIIASGISFFAPLRMRGLKIGNEAENVLVVLGGSPMRKHQESIIKVIEELDARHIDFHVMSTIHDKPSQKRNLNFYPVGSRLIELANICDTVITSAGTSLWDFIANRRVVGTFPVVDNQTENFLYCTSRGLALGMNDGHLDSELDASVLDNLISDSSVRSTLINSVVARPDFHGASRLALLLSEILSS